VTGVAGDPSQQQASQQQASQQQASQQQASQQQASQDPAGQHDASAMEALYPFLYSSTSDLPAVLEQVRASTVAKAAEITELRRLVSGREAGRLAACARETAAAFAGGGRLFAFGNGGSATDAQQLATLFLNPGAAAPALPAFCLANDTSVVTALCNDIGVDVVFARQLAAFGGQRDIAVGLSTSGNSGNLLRAFDEASRRGMLTIGLAGYEGGKMAELDSIDYLFVAPSASVHRIQEAQTTIYQVLWELTVAEFPRAAPARAAPGQNGPPRTGPEAGGREADG
jgi:D-sedoheptulose 7-phosphate isomerase